jgi:hypothetical protein
MRLVIFYIKRKNSSLVRGESVTDIFGSVQDPLASSCDHGDEPSGSTTGKEF